MAKKVSPVKHPEQNSSVTGWQAIFMQVLQIFIDGLQNIQKFVEKTTPSVDQTAAPSSATIEQVTVKTDETIEPVVEAVREIADECEEKLLEKSAEKVLANQSHKTTEAVETKSRPSVGKENINNSQNTKQKKLGIWQQFILNIRSLLPQSWQAKLSDSMITGLVTTTFVTALTVVIVIGTALIPMIKPGIALVQSGQNILLENNDNIQSINVNDQNLDILSNNVLDIKSDSHQSDINFTNNSDVQAIKPELNDQIALVNQVSDNKLTDNKLTDNSNIPLITDGDIPDNSDADSTIVNNVVADNSSQIGIAIENEKADENSLDIEEQLDDNKLNNKSNNKRSQPTDDISQSELNINNIKSSELTNNLTESIPLKETVNQDKVNSQSDINDDLNPSVQQIIPAELTTTKPDLPVEKIQVKPAPIKFTPEQYLVISIKNQIADITNRYGGGIVDSIQVNFLSGLLVVQVTEDWYDLDKIAQNQLANNLLKQTEDLDFTKLQIADTTGKLVARSPVVGEQMIILSRSQSDMIN